MSSLYAYFLFFVFLRQFEGVCSDHCYHRPGEDVTLSCDAVKHQGPNCPKVVWRHYKKHLDHTYVVLNGRIENSPRTSRLTLEPNCSLSVQNVTEGDYGEYLCGLWNDQNYKYESYIFIYLSVLSVHPTQFIFNETSTENITLQCTLWSLSSCLQDSLRWLDIDGTVLSGDGVTQKNCESTLTVELQSPQNRTFTCQYLVNGTVQVSAEYSLKGNSGAECPTDSSESKPLFVYNVFKAVVVVLLLLAAAAVVFFRIKSKKKTAKTIEDTEGDPRAPDATTDPENSVIYSMIDHHKPRAKKQTDPENSVIYSMIDHRKPRAKKQVEDDSVTYTTVNEPNTATSEHSAIYSQVKRTAQD